MMEKRTLDCGCEVLCEIKDGVIKRIQLTEEFRMDCPKTWSLCKQGLTWGVFQLESRGGQKHCRDFSPSCFNEISQLLSIIRPGCADAIMDGKSVTQKFMLRKHGKEKTECMHPCIDDITGPTYGFIIYQEQAMLISRKVAGFSLSDSYKLVKAIGKKKVELMEKMKKEFLEGAEKEGLVTKKEAELIFTGIEAAARYSFNKSHSDAYAYNCIQSAFMKSHFPRAFYIAKLKYAKDRDTVGDILWDALKLGVEISPPDLRYLNPDPVINGEVIVYPLSQVKNVSKSSVLEIKSNIKEFPKFNPDSWEDWLLVAFKGIGKECCESLVRCGSMDFLGIPRIRMVKEISHLRSRVGNGTKGKKPCKKYNYLVEHRDKGILGAIEQLLTDKSKHGTGKVLHSISSLPSVYAARSLFRYSNSITSDNLSLKARWEKDHLGKEMIYTELDAIAIRGVNSTMFEVWRGFSPKEVSVPLIVKNVKNHKTKKKQQDMAFLDAYDISMDGSVVVMPDLFDSVKHLLYNGSTILVKGKAENGGILAKEIEEI